VYIQNGGEKIKVAPLNINQFNKNTMPRFDGTGPMGYGPGTGRGFGPCGGGMGWGRGYGRGFFRGYGWRNFYTKKEESEVLKDEEAMLEDELKAVKERLAELKGQK